MNDLIIECPNGKKKEAPEAVFAMKRLMKDFLLDHGIVEGKWNLFLVKKTGGGGQDKILLRSVDESSQKPSAVFFIRPHGRDSSWLVEVRLPSGVTVSELKNKLNNISKTIEPAELHEKQLNIITNQLGKATVTAIKNVGIEINVEVGFGGREKIYRSFLSLDDVREGEYDKKELTRWPVGKSFKVIVFDVNEEEGTAHCSSHYDGYSTSKYINDKFSGSLNADNTMILIGFCDDLLRIVDVVRYVSENVKDRTTPFTFKELQPILQNYFDAKYGNGEKVVISHMQFVSLSVGLRSGAVPLLERVLEGKERKYLITEAGWNEFDGMKRMEELEAQAPELEAQEAIVESEPISVPELPPEPVPKEISFINIMEYHSKETKLDFIEESIKAEQERIIPLEMEKEEILKYFETNKHLKEELDKLIESATAP
jgi:hypothetical protein